MDLMRQRIEQRLEELGLSPRAASLLAERNGHWLQNILSGKAKSPTAAHLKKLAEVLEVSFEWLMGGEGDAPESPQIALRKYIGAGAIVVPFEDSFALEYVRIPPGAKGIIGAARVRGDSQYPVYRDGDVVFWTADISSIDECVGRECIVKLADGREMLKVLERGSADNLWTLNSHNAAPIRDVTIESVCRVAWVEKAK